MTWFSTKNNACCATARSAFWPSARRWRTCASCATASDASGFARSCGRSFGEHGLQRACWCPKRTAALGLGFVEAGADCREIGHKLAPTPFLSTAVLAAALLMRGGSPGAAEARGCRASRGRHGHRRWRSTNNHATGPRARRPRPRARAAAGASTAQKMLRARRPRGRRLIVARARPATAAPRCSLVPERRAGRARSSAR